VPAYRCPADKRDVNGQPVVRSFSMNSWMNGRSHGDPTGASTFNTPDADGGLTYILFRKENQIAQPARMWCLIDEDAETINDSLFVVDMSADNGIPDRPSTRHGNAYELTFADGHSENIRLVAPITTWETGNSDGPDPDWVKLKSLTTVHR
jgi:hypothetical protein